MIKESEVIRCKECKRIVGKLVPFADCDNVHAGKMTCIKCKKILKVGEKPKVFKVAETGETDLRNVKVE